MSSSLRAGERPGERLEERPGERLMERGDVDLKEEESSQYQGGKVIEETYRNFSIIS